MIEKEVVFIYDYDCGSLTNYVKAARFMKEHMDQGYEVRIY